MGGNGGYNVIVNIYDQLYIFTIIHGQVDSKDDPFQYFLNLEYSEVVYASLLLGVP